MAKQFVSFLLLSQCLAAALAIQCYHCSWNNFDSSNAVLSFFLGTMSKLSNDDCRMLVENDFYELDVRNCPEPRPGHVYKCGVFDGTVEAEIFGFDVEYNTIERDCIEVEIDDSDYSDGCHDELPLSGPIRDLVDQTFDGTDMVDVTYSGNVCYDSTGISVSGPMCPRCTYTRVETSNDILQFFIDAIRAVSDDSCLFQDGDDVYDVTYRVCPPGSFGQVSKCGDIDGRITGRLAGIDFEVTTLQRDCVMGSPSDETYSNGCHTDINDSPIISPLIEESTAGVSGISGENFDGAACFESYFAPLVAGGANDIRSHLALPFVTVFLALCSVLLL